jgi:hypothetical protein
MSHHQTCIYEGCSKISSFNYVGLKRQYCSTHVLPNMVNVKHKKCSFENCNNLACFNLKKNKIPLFCSTHKNDNMINVNKVNSLCQNENCNYEALFNYHNEKKGIFCSQHKLIDMIDIKHKKCQCGKYSPSFNYANMPAKYCSECKNNDMVTISKKKCINDACSASSNKKYKNYCFFCFQHLYPLDPLNFQKRNSTKEIAVRNFINLNFDGFLHDKSIFTGNCDCTHRRRIDHRKLINNTLLCIETDETQHKRYNKNDEDIRYDDLFMIHGGKFIFIRFNPDSYKNLQGNKINTPLYIRLQKLEIEMMKQINRILNHENTELLEIIYLFYDEN